MCMYTTVRLTQTQHKNTHSRGGAPSEGEAIQRLPWPALDDPRHSARLLEGVAPLTLCKQSAAWGKVATRATMIDRVAHNTPRPERHTVHTAAYDPRLPSTKFCDSPSSSTLPSPAKQLQLARAAVKNQRPREGTLELTIVGSMPNIITNMRLDKSYVYARK